MKPISHRSISGAFAVGALVAGLPATARASEFSGVISLPDSEGFTLGLALLAVGASALAIVITAIVEAVLRRAGRPHAPGRRH